jgi:hypothetical protein
MTVVRHIFESLRWLHLAVRELVAMCGSVVEMMQQDGTIEI